MGIVPKFQRLTPGTQGTKYIFCEILAVCRCEISLPQAKSQFVMGPKVRTWISITLTAFFLTFSVWASNDSDSLLKACWGMYSFFHRVTWKTPKIRQKNTTFLEVLLYLSGKNSLGQELFCGLLLGQVTPNNFFPGKSPERFLRYDPELFGKIFARLSVISRCPPCAKFFNIICLFPGIYTSFCQILVHQLWFFAENEHQNLNQFLDSLIP